MFNGFRSQTFTKMNAGNKKSKKAQITIFIIVGLVIVISFSLLIFMLSSSKEREAVGNIQSAIKTELDTKTVNFIAEDCLRKTLEDGILLIGERGGYFKREDFSNPQLYGNLSPPKMSEAGTAYLIEMTEALPPWYPCPYPTEEPLHCGYINDPLIFKDLSKIKYGAHNGIAGSFIIKQLEAYIKDKLPICTKFDQMTNITPNLRINSSVNSVKIQFTSETVLADVDYQIDIYSYGSKSDKKITKIKADIPVRLGKLYTAILELLRYDTAFLDFDMIGNPQNGTYKSIPLAFGAFGGEISIKSVPLEENAANDVFIVNESVSVIRGKPFQFKFVRQNRNPVLDLIPPANKSEIEKINSIKLEFLRIAQFSQSERPEDNQDILEIKARAIDPDEDLLLYTHTQSNSPVFANWVPSTAVNYSLLDSDIQDLSMTLVDSDVGYHSIVTTASDGYLEDIQRMRIFVERLLRIIDITYENFYPVQSSPDIKKAYASIEDPFYLTFNHPLMFQQSEPGIDPQYTYRLKMDNQDVLAVQMGHNAARKYIIFQDMAISTSQPTLASFSINDIKRKYLARSGVTDSSARPFTHPPTQIRNISLEISTSGLIPQQKTFTFPIEVKRCLPYYTNNYAYPYQKFSKTAEISKPGAYDSNNNINPFMGSHDCCKTDSNKDYRITTREGYQFEGYQYCFVMEYYTSRPTEQAIYFPATLAKKIDPSNGQVMDYGYDEAIVTRANWGTGVDDLANDIYQRSFRQSCAPESGSSVGRGNVCGGTAQEIWLAAKECSDLRTGETARCKGPSRYPPGRKENGAITGLALTSSEETYDSTYQGMIPVSAADVKVLSGEATCYSYGPQETFEKNFYSQGSGECRPGGYYCNGFGDCTLGGTTS